MMDKFIWYDKSRDEELQDKYDDLRSKFIMESLKNNLDDLFMTLIKSDDICFGEYDSVCNFKHLTYAFESDNPFYIEKIWESFIEGPDEEEYIYYAKIYRNILINNLKNGQNNVIQKCIDDKTFTENTIYNILWNYPHSNIRDDIKLIKKISSYDLNKWFKSWDLDGIEQFDNMTRSEIIAKMIINNNGYREMVENDELYKHNIISTLIGLYNDHDQYKDNEDKSTRIGVTMNILLKKVENDFDTAYMISMYNEVSDALGKMSFPLGDYLKHKLETY